MVFIECMACGTPVIGAKSGGPTSFVTPDQGELIKEEDKWQTEEGMKNLAHRLAEKVKEALNADWKGTTKGPNCVPFVTENYSTMKQCTEMLRNMEEWR